MDAIPVGKGSTNMLTAGTVPLIVVVLAMLVVVLLIQVTWRPTQLDPSAELSSGSGSSSLRGPRNRDFPNQSQSVSEAA